MKLLAVDYGSKRIGLAISQGTLALPLTTIERGRGDRAAVAAIAVLAREEGVTGLVVGEPRRLDGTIGEAAEKARAFGEALAAATRLPLALVDEALSSRAAEARLREAGVDPRRHPERVDQVAAQIILEQVLRDRERAGEEPLKRGCFGRALRLLGLLLLLGAIAGGALAWYGWRTLETPVTFRGERRVEVVAGSGVGVILASLERAGVIADARLARAWLLLHRNPPLQAGEYLFRPPLTTEQALGKLIRGEVAAHRVTIVEGLTLEEIADRLAAAKLGDRDAFLREMRNPAPIHDLDPQAPDLEGYLFPDSYSFTAGATPHEIVGALAADFRRRWRQQVEPALPPGSAARTGGRSVREIVTLASIVEKEARLASERPLIAAVYANRLQQGAGLYADPTIIYALKKLGRWDGDIRRQDLQLDSPYNTYKHAGLPPGPICSPGAGSLVAAAAPADVPYLYFVARNDGSHVFATTLEEHNRNVAQWQRRYWRERREHETEAAATPSPAPAARGPARRR